MSLLHFDGFEGQDWATVYSPQSGYAANTSTRFSYGHCIQASGASNVISKLFTAATDTYIGVAVRSFNPSGGSNQWSIDFKGDAGATTHITVRPNANLGIDVLRGATTIASSANGILPAASQTWSYIEIHVKVSDTVGVVDIRLNGNTTAVVTFSGDTKNAGTNSTIDMVTLTSGSSSTAATGWDDYYICDGLGTVNNGFLGDVRVQTLVPTGAGSWTQLTPSTGSNYQNVDEAPYSTTDYNGSAVAGTRDTYAMTDLLTGTSSVLGVKNNAYWHKSDAGLASMKHILANPTVTYAADNFNRANGALGSTSTGGKTWVAVNGGFQITSNVAGQNGSVGVRNWNYIDIGVTSYELQMTVASVGADAFGFAFRHVDANNALFAVFSGTSAGGAAIVKYVAGTATTLVSGSSYAGVAGDVIKLTVVGNVLTLFRNGVQQCTVTDSTFQSSTKVGLYSQFNGFGNSWDDFSAVSPAAVYSGTTVALSASPTLHSDLHETNPLTSAAWAVAEVNAIEVGAEVV